VWILEHADLLNCSRQSTVADHIGHQPVDHEGPGGAPAPPHCEFPAVTLKVELLDEFPWQVFGKRLDILRAEKRVDVLNVRCVLQAADRVD